MKKYHDLSNKRFGRLLVVSPASKPSTTQSRNKFWLCTCDCGNQVTVAARNLKSGNTQSCGCLQRERSAESATKNSVRHGCNRVGRATKEYIAWRAMISRCTNQNNPAFPRYGGRGIVVCDRWRDSFKAFLDNLGLAPSPRHSIDRIDNDGNYEPRNVRWATWSQQSRNRCDRRYYTFNGKTLLLSDWSKETGIKITTLHSRLKRGWSVERVLTTDPKLYHKKL